MESKICPRCEQDLPLTKFRKKGGRKTGLQSFCIPCNREYQREHYRKNKSSYKERAARDKRNSTARAYKFLMEYAADGCSECEEKEFVCLEFDHIDPKTKIDSISRMIQNQYSLDKIREELKKCRILCANCHRKHTASQFGWYACIESMEV